MRKWWVWLGIILAAGTGAGHADYRGGTIRIGVLNDQSGLYADIAGTASVWVARKAAEDFGAAAKGMKVEILSGDHQNKPDIGLSIARQWFALEISRSTGQAQNRTGAARTHPTDEQGEPPVGRPAHPW
jgi:branched-chain amino acid transport system substrate-binding protein